MARLRLFAAVAAALLAAPLSTLAQEDGGGDLGAAMGGVAAQSAQDWSPSSSGAESQPGQADYDVARNAANAPQNPVSPTDKQVTVGPDGRTQVSVGDTFTQPPGMATAPGQDDSEIGRTQVSVEDSYDTAPPNWVDVQAWNRASDAQVASDALHMDSFYTQALSQLQQQDAQESGWIAQQVSDIGVASQTGTNPADGTPNWFTNTSSDLNAGDGGADTADGLTFALGESGAQTQQLTADLAQQHAAALAMLNNPGAYSDTDLKDATLAEQISEQTLAILADYQQAIVAEVQAMNDLAATLCGR
jgi:hypothetical protein